MQIAIVSKPRQLKTLLYDTCIWDINNNRIKKENMDLLRLGVDVHVPPPNLSYASQLNNALKSQFLLYKPRHVETN